MAARRVKPEKLALPGKMGMTTSTIIAKKKAYTCKACTKNIPTVCLCADRVRCQPDVSMVTE